MDPQYITIALKQVFRKWQFHHEWSNPLYPRVKNAERSVQIVRKLLETDFGGQLRSAFNIDRIMQLFLWNTFNQLFKSHENTNL